MVKEKYIIPKNNVTFCSIFFIIAATLEIIFIMTRMVDNYSPSIFDFFYIIIYILSTIVFFISYKSNISYFSIVSSLFAIIYTLILFLTATGMAGIRLFFNINFIFLNIIFTLYILKTIKNKKIILIILTISIILVLFVSLYKLFVYLRMPDFLSMYEGVNIPYFSMAGIISNLLNLMPMVSYALGILFIVKKSILTAVDNISTAPLNTVSKSNSSENDKNYCFKCGYVLNTDSVFCEKCGTKIISEETIKKQERIKEINKYILQFKQNIIDENKIFEQNTEIINNFKNELNQLKNTFDHLKYTGDIIKDIKILVENKLIDFNDNMISSIETLQSSLKYHDLIIDNLNNSINNLEEELFSLKNEFV